MVIVHGGRELGGRTAARPAHSRVAITRLVIEELERVRPVTSRSRLEPAAALADAGIDAARFLDAVARIEGRYQMRFRDEWLHDVRTCDDLIDCVERRM